ncbi:MAG: GAF domain-containing protein [Chthonomonas sp.]|nr:GAF domain-containing protein [Chthonomonas sp.]
MDRLGSHSGEVSVRPRLTGDASLVLSAILGAVEYGVLLTDLDHVAIAANRRFGELFGINPDVVVQSEVDAVRQMVESRIGAFEDWRDNLSRVYADPESVQNDILELRNPSATLLRHSGPIRDATATPVGRLWTFLDITKERKQERFREALHEASLHFDPDPKRVYQRIVEQIGDLYQSIAVLSIRKGDFMEFHAVGGPYAEARALPGNPVEEAYCQFCLESNSGVIVQDASTNPLAANLMPARLGFTRYAGVPLNSPDGTVIGTLCILDTRTHELLTEADLQFLSVMAMRISSELEREAQLKGLERDLRVAQAQVIQNEKLATTGTLSAAIAHDIRNIVTAMSLEMEMDSSSSETVRKVQMHLDRFSVLAHRLLSYARPKEVVLQRTNIAESIQRVLDLLEQHFRVARIECKAKIESADTCALTDPSRLDHLFLNLMMNAIQAMSAGGRLEVRTFVEGSNVVIEVEDSGSGMTEEMVVHAFEPFRTSRRGGFGLGLYSCKQIVEDCKGSITLRSSQGQGTTFRVEIPTA